ncbi:hypothetical protein BDW66DRAFT_144257 [Aspergillus desertorum]
MELTVAEVSGLIAAGVFVLQILIPLAIPWALSAFLSQENSVTTWTVLARFLHSSLWPSILGSSSAETAGVPWRIYLTSWGQTALLFILSVAAVCSPLGLYSSVEPASSATEKLFSYIADESAFGYGTPVRSEGPFTRFCGLESPCPGTTLTKTCETQGLAEVCNNTTYESTIPESLLTLFDDGAAAVSPTVASIFSMQYRTYRNSTDQYSRLGWYTKPDYRTMSVQLLEDKVKMVEGLITDLRDGGIGFRNHTAPKETQKYGASWTEDILFIEPETECVPLNLSIHALTPPWNFNGRFLENVSLVDEGGFANLPRTAAPASTATVNGQGGLDLRDRAYKAAWLNNYYTMVFLDVTDGDSQSLDRVDSVQGQRVDLWDGRSNNNFTIAFSAIQTNLNYGAYLNLTTNQNRKFNPHNVTALDFRAASTICGGTTNSSPSNINSTLVACGLVLGAATRTDGGDDRILDPATPWTIPLYSCATAIKALVKAVEFHYNGTGFDAMSVRSLRSKTHDDPATLPVWGVEDLPEHDIDTAPPMWGLISPNASTTILTHYNISTISSESLYLPGYMTPEYPLLRGLNSVPSGTGQNLPGVEFYNQALMTAYTVGAQGFNPEADYSGAQSLALYAKWQRLSKTAEGTARIIDLVWTDVATNAVVGTAGWGLTASASSVADGDRGLRSDSVNVPVFVYGSHIRYHIPWAVPAFVTLGATTVLLGLLVTVLVTSRTGVKRLRLVLESTTVGRVLAPFLPAVGDGNDPGDDAEGQSAGLGTWVRRVGERKVLITAEAILVDGVVLRGDGEKSIQTPAVDEQQSRTESELDADAHASVADADANADADADADADANSPLQPDRLSPV